MKIKKGRLLGLAMAGVILLNSATAMAEESLVAKTEFQVQSKVLYAELWGEKLAEGYTKDLLLLIKNDAGRVVTAYQPTIKGGYSSMLMPVKVDGKGAQLLVGVTQGDWQSITEYRILDISEPAAVKELFSSGDCMGIVTEAERSDTSLTIKFTNGESSTLELDKELIAQVGRRTDFGGIHSLTPYDADEDGRQELLISQRVSSGRLLMADVGAILQLDALGKWQPKGMTVMVAAPPDKNNTVNNGRDFVSGSIVPRRIVVPGGEASYPVFLNNDKLELQKQFNETLQQECKPYLQKFYDGEADMAFNVVAADNDLLSIRLISGKNSFRHHHINIDPATGKLLRIEDILDVKNPDLVPLLELLSSNRSMMFEGVPREWYIEGENLFFVQNICGQEEVSGYNLGNLHKYLLDKKWLSRKAQ